MEKIKAEAEFYKELTELLFSLDIEKIAQSFYNNNYYWSVSKSFLEEYALEEGEDYLLVEGYVDRIIPKSKCIKAFILNTFEQGFNDLMKTGNKEYSSSSGRFDFSIICDKEYVGISCKYVPIQYNSF